MTWKLEIENIAGIRSGAATIEPGLNVVHAENWQGKSSFLKSIRTVFGTANPITESCDEGYVELREEETTTTVRLTRADGRIIREGDPVLETPYDRRRAILFAFLGEENEIRRAVRRGEDLEDELTAPLDLQNIDEQITALTEKREDIERQLEQAERAADDAIDLEQRVQELSAELEELRSERSSMETHGDSDSGSTTQALADKQAQLERQRNRKSRLESTVQRVEDRLTELDAAESGIDVPEAAVGEELATVETELRRLNSDIDLLQSLYSANHRLLEEDRLELVADIDRSIAGDVVSCWVCGADSDRETIESYVTALGERLSDARAERDELQQRHEELKSRREQRQEAEKRLQEIRDQQSELERQLEEKRESLADVEERIEELEDKVEALESEAEAASEQRTDIESEIKFTETKLEETKASLEEKRDTADRRPELEARRDELTAEITDLRTEKKTTKRRLRTEFEDAVDDVIERFETGFEKARLTDSFNLVVARDGREASLDALSEGERELLGLLVALAGHEAFEVGEDVPVLLFDGLGALSAANLEKLADYVEGRAERIVFTAYPEHSTEGAHEIDPADWKVVSGRDEA
ncbi:Smc-like protein Sph1 [Natronomonas pharaonis DSM 2160]|uniref:Smc-like protein Sph1 n=1 Tax=Natronomonas pharaonis (strain ATCC 35678 / DSM 2160 / CIP 103997 / JCM 8858 / NBRC 14720 / NCIMB 2260 / Gabara) TaxID=348780 RepID=Q3IQ02_NATPD|nr:archaea-specific SMC-related protein [Natronomonas pharaonis]CAI49796.1 Smc-like protein Sph1 [Natronomonas pharaonis DSM 2160]